MSIEDKMPEVEPSKAIKATARSAPTKTKSVPAMKSLDKRKSYPMVGATKSLDDKMADQVFRHHQISFQIAEESET